MPNPRPPGPWTDPPRPQSPTIELSSGSARARIATRGAEPVSWSVDGAELLWDADPTWWPKSSPVLFPLCGQTRTGTIKVDGVRYPIPVHGVAPTSAFSVEDQGPDRVRMVLRDDAATRAAFPFAFALTADYRLECDRFSAEFTVRNPGDVVMPYAMGFHPGFNWPFAGGDKHRHAIVFECDEDPMVPVIEPGGGFLTTRRALAMEGRRLPLVADLIAGTPLCFLNARSRSVRFEDDQGAAIVVAVENIPHFAIWAKAGAPYLSIEAWTGHADPADFDGELADKPSMLFLEPGATAQHVVWLSYEAT